MSEPTLNIDELEQLALAATPNQWKPQEFKIVASNRFVIAKVSSPDHRLKGKEWHEENTGCKANAAYIAYANHANILALIKLVRENVTQAIVDSVYHPDAQAVPCGASIAAIDSAEHQIHADGHVVALADRAATYHPDPAPAMRKHPMPAIYLTQQQTARVLDWWDVYPSHWQNQSDLDLVFALKLAADGDEPDLMTPDDIKALATS